MNKTRALAQVSALALALATSLSVHAQAAAGTTLSTDSTLTGSRLTAGEHPWVIRILSYHPSSVVPRRTYTASCTTSTGQRKIFASLASKTSTGTTTSGLLLSGNVAASGAVSGVTQRVFPGCKEMNGIAATDNCSTVVALCRRPPGSTGANGDLVAALPNTATGNQWRDWLTAEQATDDQMWLYEWKGTSSAPAAPTSTATPSMYVVSKAIGGGWEYGHQHVVIGASHYGISMKSTTGKDSNGVQHQGDSYVMVTRNTPTIDTSRGWPWACGQGHTLSNRPVVSSSGIFAAMCTTDWHGVANNYTQGGTWMRVEGKSPSLIRGIYKSVNNGLIFNGGTGPVLAISGGFLGVIVGSDLATVARASKIALVRMNADGVAQGLAWVSSNPGYFVSYPQVVSLGDDNTGTPRFLVGWAEMMPNSATSSLDTPNPDNTQRLARKYFVQEFDQYGTAKTQRLEIANGWGEQDTMVKLGRGMAGWAYIPNPRYATPLPSPNSATLRWTTYRSTSM